jgi:hypothetical protein
LKLFPGGAGERGASLFAAGEAVGAAVGEVSEPDPVEPAVHTRGGLLEAVSAHGESELDVLLRGEELDQSGVLGDVAKGALPPADGAARRGPGDGDPAPAPLCGARRSPTPTELEHFIW